MSIETRERLQHALHEMQRNKGVSPLKRLFLTELEYEPENIPLPRTSWPESAREALLEDPQILFGAGNTGDRFYVIYCRLADDKDRLLLTKERAVISYLLDRYPYALFVFSRSHAE